MSRRLGIAGLLFAVVARAQAPAGFDTLSAKSIGDSLRVLKEMEAATRANPKDAAAWHRRGAIAFALAERTNVRPAPGLDYRMLHLSASDALNKAISLEPDNEDYLLTLAQFHIADHTPAGHAAAYRMFDELAQRARLQPDTAKRAQRILDAARYFWLNYDAYEGRAMGNCADQTKYDLDGRVIIGSGTPACVESSPPSVFVAATQDPFKCGIKCEITPDMMAISTVMIAAVDSVRNTMGALGFEAAGEKDYLRARELFEEAYALRPSDERVYHDLAMLYVSRDNWKSLRTLASEHVKRSPDDGWGYMALALALHRLHDKNAAATFEAALLKLSASERNRLDDLRRVLRLSDSTAFLRLDSTAKRNVAQSSWALADPLWSSSREDPRTEFLARLTYAELRWSVAEQHVRGSETARGGIFVRYGPPNLTLGSAIQFWVYNADLIFAFQKYAHMGLAKIVPRDTGIVERIVDWQPARWDNIAEGRIDSMPTQSARFRAGDSVDVYLAAHASVDTLRSAAAANSPVRSYFWLYSRNSPAGFVDTLALEAPGQLQWTRRVAPGPYYYRLEAGVPEAAVTARSAATIVADNDATTGFSTRGFGLSDILLASRVDATASARRWNDFTVTPILGNLKKGAELSLLWENYELGREPNGNVSYQVAISIERERSRAGRIAAAVVSKVAGTIGVNSSPNKVVMRFDRALPFAAAIPDNVALALRDTPAGSYRLTVEITDRVTRRTSARSMRIVIDE